MRAKHQIYNRIGFFDLFRHMFLLHHTAANSNNLLRIRFFGMVECSDVSENAHLCMLPHCAGVYDDDIRIKFILCKTVSHLSKVSSDLLTVSFVLLAAVSIHHGQRMSPGSIDTFKDLSADRSLPADLLCADGLPFVHAVPPSLRKS